MTITESKLILDLDRMLQIAGAQHQALLLCLAFVKQCGELGLPYSTLALEVSDGIAGVLLSTNLELETQTTGKLTSLVDRAAPL